MINREKALEEERIDEKIESLLRKINAMIISYKIGDKEFETTNNIKNIILPKLQQFINMYENEYMLFHKDAVIEEGKRKQIERQILEALGIIIADLKHYYEDINRMMKEAMPESNINDEYNDIQRIYAEYYKKSETMISYVHALE
jgi:hypothetical protein